MASVFLPGESPWTGELGGPCPWGRKESDTTTHISDVSLVSSIELSS